MGPLQKRGSPCHILPHLPHRLPDPMTGIWKYWWHILAPTSLQSARIAQKTSLIESYQFSTSKLCTKFFSNSNQKIFFFGIKNISQKKIGQKYFSWKSRKIQSENFDFFSDIFFWFWGFSSKNIFGWFFFPKNIFDPEKKYFLVGVGKKLGT